MFLSLIVLKMGFFAANTLFSLYSFHFVSKFSFMVRSANVARIKENLRAKYHLRGHLPTKEGEECPRCALGFLGIKHGRKEYLRPKKRVRIIIK